MEAYQRGNASAFEELVTRHERQLRGFLRGFVGDAATADDLLQEVFFRVVRGGAGWKPEAKFSTWLYTIARNLCTDEARRKVFRRTTSLDAPSAPGGDEGSGPALGERIAGTPGAGAHGEAAAMDRQLAGEIDRAVAALPPDQREVFLMREVMDMSFTEIAAAVGSTEGTAKSRMRYALEKLRRALAEFHEAPAAEQREGGL